MQPTFETQPFRPQASSKNDDVVRDGIMPVGYILLSLSVLVYGITEYVGPAHDHAVGIFVVHYVIALAFVIVLLTNGAYGFVRSWRKENIHKTIVLLNLFLVSAYALNREIAVFNVSTPWLCVYLVVISAAALVYRFYHQCTGFVQAVLQFLMGSALVFYLYLAVYAVPFYAIGGIGILLLGVGMHIFVPVTLLIGVFILIRHTYRGQDRSCYWVVIGAVLTIGYASVFAWEWNKRVNALTDLINQSPIETESDLPSIISIAQKIKPDWITLRLLKSDLVYATYREGQWGFSRRGNWVEEKHHDPLVYFSTYFSKSPLSNDERMEILKIIFKHRHDTEERLWRSDQLSTAYVVSDIDIYPDLRLAYTEEYLTIENHAESSWSNQEALYTFQLPEGSVATSLSLWIDGKESKGMLTSKQKATKAYNTIVGVEVRDPSVVHWQEGNRVTVRVFPCTPTEQRKVKIGITTPLIEEHGKLKLQNIGFEGPDFDQTRQTRRVRFLGTTRDVDLTDNFKRDPKGYYVAEGDYDPDFEVVFDAVPLKKNQFTFDGYTYSIAPAVKTFDAFTAGDLYLDINSSWTREECDAIKPLANTKNVWVWFDNDFVKLSESNFDTLSNTLRQYNFSLFPFYNLKDRSISLVVTKGNPLTPHLSDLKGSPYAEKIQHYFALEKKVRVFNLEGGTSAYMLSLRELRGLEYASGSVDELITLLKHKQFPVTKESGQSVVLHDAGLEIRKERLEKSTMLDNAPDHLARLFAYNDIMRKVGTRYYADDEFVDDDLVKEAMAAYVVSPVSSLVVLEKREDYDRFAIEASKNSLQNASKNSSGAVPEPHEWALIILFVLVGVYLKVKR